MKIGLIYALLGDRWESCQKIASNLIRAYKLKYTDISMLSVNSKTSLDEYFSSLDVVQEIKKKKIENLVFVDYRPHPLFIIQKLDELKLYPRIIFHIYGDYILFVKEWLKLNETLKKFEVQFIAASDAQASLVSKTLIENTCEKIPFPVDCSKYKYCKNLTSKIINKTEEEIRLVYTGRITHQKNNILLLKTLEMINKLTGKHVKLFIAGKFDDLGYPYFGKVFRKHNYKRMWDKTIEIMNLNHDDVVYLGNLNEIELIELYNSTDIYISFSTHNDEDYGMSPAEAFCCGMDGILTKWGGFKSFSIDPSINLIDVDFTDTIKHNIQSKKVLKILQQFKRKSSSERENLSLKFKNELDIPVVAKKIEKIISGNFTKFNGFNDLLMKVEDLFQQEKTAPFLDLIMDEKYSVINGVVKADRNVLNKLNSTYKELYIEYIK